MLFTNIPLQETIDIAINLIFNHNPNLNITRKELNKSKFYDIVAAFDNEQDLLNFLNSLNNKHPNIKLTIEKLNNHSNAFLDVFISGIIIKIPYFRFQEFYIIFI